jgi:hypothetical protein
MLNMQKPQYLHTSYKFVETERQTIGWFVHADRIEWQIAICDKSDMFVKATGRDMVIAKLIANPMTITREEMATKFAQVIDNAIHPKLVKDFTPTDMTQYANSFVRAVVSAAAYDFIAARKTRLTWR